jgi:hypothetical protein
VTIDAPNRRSVRPVFIPDLSGTEVLRVELIDSGSGSMLAVADATTFAQGRVSAR